MSSAPTAPLDYARPSTTRRNRRIAAATILATLTLLTYVLYHRYYPALSNWYALASLRHAALTHTLPRDTPALTLLPIDTHATWSASGGVSHCAPLDPVWEQTQFRLAALLQSSPASIASLFLHERRTPAGHTRLVSLDFRPMYNPDGLFLTANLRLFTTGSLRSPHFPELTVRKNPQLPLSGSIPSFPGVIVRLGYVPWGSDFRLYPAQPDPADPTAFTLPYTLNGRPGSFVFHLTDDDSATITPRGVPFPPAP